MPAFLPDLFLAHAAEWQGKFHYHSELESTNDEAARLGADGAAHGTLVLAEHQTKGRGRRGAEWLSAPGDGLMFSILLRPDFAREKWGRLALAAGLGIADALRRNYGIDARLKWPNDVIIDHGKCCGILVEAQTQFVVLGVGINVSGAPNACSCIESFAKASAPIARELVLAELVTGIMNELKIAGSCFESQVERINTIDYLVGQRIQFESGERSYEGDALGITPEGSLMVRVAGHDVQFNQVFNIRVLGLE